MARKLTGIRPRHARSSAAPGEGKCSCRPTWEASVFSRREGKKIHKTFPTLDAAKAWQADARVALRKRTLRTPSRVTLRQAPESWLEGAKAGAITKPNGQAYKPSVLPPTNRLCGIACFPILAVAGSPRFVASISRTSPAVSVVPASARHRCGHGGAGRLSRQPLIRPGSWP